VATRSIYVTLGTKTLNGDYPSVTSKEDGADVVSAVATLVADAASPTQAHVTALTTAQARQGDLVLQWNTTNITTVTQLRKAVDAALRQVAGNGMAL
jgi:hypothetical protein